MLQQTFLHIPGIGRETERDMWLHGIRNWDDADHFEKRFGVLGARLQQRLDDYIPRSRQAIKDKDAQFFQRLSEMGEAWRVFPEFVDQCVYLDIETTGLSTVFDSVTVVGLYDGRRYDVFVQGSNLDQLQKALKKYSVVVTFNGAGFDLRFLRAMFPDIVFPPIHIDLRWVCRRLGYRGGLKEVERQCGLMRNQSISDVGGYEATVLWAKHLRGDKAAFDQLIEYNTADVVHLKALMEICYDRLTEQTAEFLKGGIAPIFTGVAELPKRARLSATRKPALLASGREIVANLLRKVGTESGPKIVGIDLTGSERRATGWALLDGSCVMTQALRTDEELIRETVAAKPDLVSIDSPLSLPEGVTDCDSVGTSPIYRKCELALKRMGISVFWCLLPTMKCLTRRGMLLAKELRDRGIRVIESYPGAAQDLLGIPRKGASLEELKQGMGRIGIAGPYLNERVTHDEVDAITSALVGLFYLADDYIALGTSTEDYLIVPRSPSINYQKLAEILNATGLDAI
ncbi:MAG: ribonuclease H-like domain-containing protein [Acidobacteriaceae bacterium]